MNNLFTVAIIRDLNHMVKSGVITSSKMVELMNEAVNRKELGNKYLLEVISDIIQLNKDVQPIDSTNPLQKIYLKGIRY